MTDFKSSLSKEDKELLKKKEQPDEIKPMLATLTHSHFSKESWIYERKFDGERCIIFYRSKDIEMVSRNQKKLNNRYPELVEAASNLSQEEFIIDGEIVTFENEVTSFSKLQSRMHTENPDQSLQDKVPVYYYVFDILHFDGYDLTQLPLRKRKIILKDCLNFSDPIRYTRHRNKEGEAYLTEACDNGWEGLIAKKADSKYVTKRSRNWLKFKCVHQQEFVIGGYTDPQGERIGFGALLIGYYDDGDLIYSGKVGTGYDDKMLERMIKDLEELEQENSPFDKGEIEDENVHWITPKLVCEVGFTEWTENNKLRHPKFLGLRDDKNPKDVVKEEKRAAEIEED